jgi:four helix bundle protein
MGDFDFERLDIYKRSIEFADFAYTIADSLPRSLQSSLADQLRRAVISICNNIAEGSGKLSPREKRQFYHYALDSARECVPIIALIQRRVQSNIETNERFRNEIEIVCKMLTKLILSVKEKPY